MVIFASTKGPNQGGIASTYSNFFSIDFDIAFLNIYTNPHFSEIFFSEKIASTFRIQTSGRV